MATPAPILQIYSVGPTTVVGFGGKDVLADINLAVCRDEILALIEREKCEVLAFDLTGVTIVPSGMLGLLASIRQHGTAVHIYNPSPDVREVLEVTHLDQLMPIHDIS